MPEEIKPATVTSEVPARLSVPKSCALAKVSFSPEVAAPSSSTLVIVTVSEARVALSTSVIAAVSAIATGAPPSKKVTAKSIPAVGPFRSTTGASLVPLMVIVSVTSLLSTVPSFAV